MNCSYTGIVCIAYWLIEKVYMSLFIYQYTCKSRDFKHLCICQFSTLVIIVSYYYVIYIYIYISLVLSEVFGHLIMKFLIANDESDVWVGRDEMCHVYTTWTTFGCFGLMEYANH